MCGCHDALACTGVHAEVIFGVRLAHPARIRGGRCTRRPYQSLMLMLVGSQISCPTTAGMSAGHQHARCRARCGAAMAVGSISAMEARAMAVPLPTTEEMIDDEEMMNTTLSLRLGRVRGQSPYGSVCCRPNVSTLGQADRRMACAGTDRYDGGAMFSSRTHNKIKSQIHKKFHTVFLIQRTETKPVA
jgi:hypothetical protein